MFRTSLQTVTVVVLTVALWQATAQAYLYSDYSWVTYNGHSYAITLEHSNWTQAEAWAQELGGHLVQVDDLAENAWLSTQFQGYYAQSAPDDPWASLVWIGLEYVGGDRLDRTSWQWSTGGPLTFDPAWWINPNNYTGVHTYLHTDTHPNPGTWLNYEGHDLIPASYAQGIIELTQPVPLPAAFVLASLGLGSAGWLLRRRTG